MRLGVRCFSSLLHYNTFAGYIYIYIYKYIFLSVSLVGEQIARQQSRAADGV